MTGHGTGTGSRTTIPGVHGLWSEPAAPVYQTAAECSRVLCLLGALQWPWESESNALLLTAGTWHIQLCPGPNLRARQVLTTSRQQAAFFYSRKKKATSVTRTPRRPLGGWVCHRRASALTHFHVKGIFSDSVVIMSRDPKAACASVFVVCVNMHVCMYAIYACICVYTCVMCICQCDGGQKGVPLSSTITLHLVF